MLLSAVGRYAPDQLSPFSHLHDFDPDNAEHYKGTIFRFPLRLHKAESSIDHAQKNIDQATVKSLLNNYLKVARTALLFLRHVRSIEFHIRGSQEPQWTVSAERARLESGKFHQVTVTVCQTSHQPIIDTWCVGFEEIRNIPSDIERTGKGVGKATECGVAACLRSTSNIRDGPQKEATLSEAAQVNLTAISRNPPTSQQIFCRLPTNHTNSLPVSFHASFAVTGDRRAITISKGTDNAVWNRWLLEKCLAPHYKTLLEFLAPRLGHGVFRFWPDVSSSSIDASSSSADALGECLGKALWNTLKGRDGNSCLLLPLTDQRQVTDDHEGLSDLQATYKTTSIATATFDFLSSADSKRMQRLFVKLFPLLVRPPLTLMTKLKLAASVSNEVDSQCLGEAFQTEGNCRLLETFLNDCQAQEDKHSIMATILRIMIPKLRAGGSSALDILNGCRIIPRPDLSHPLGTLVKEPPTSNYQHLYATPEEQALFAFASDTMINTELFSRPTSDFPRLNVDSYHDPVAILLDAPFNVRTMTDSDIGAILRHAKSPIQTTNYPDHDKWLKGFWKHLDTKLIESHRRGMVSNPRFEKSVDTLLEECNLLDLPLYRTRDRQTRRYLTPRDVQAEPCILYPLNGEHHQLCEQIPGLISIDRDCVPSLLREKERDFGTPASFSRLLRTLDKLENTGRISAKVVVGNMDCDSRTTMRDLLTGSIKESSGHSMLRRLPVWPRCKRSTQPPYEHIAAEDARFCRYSSILAPWVTSLSKFVEPQLVIDNAEELTKLGITLMSPENAWELIRSDVPSRFTTTESRRQYCGFLQFLVQYEIRASGKIAVNGTTTTCDTDSLYDHNEPIFAAAFREQKTTRFLHQDMQTPMLRPFWIQLCLRTRSSNNAIGHAYYLECAQAISRRWDPTTEDLSFADDALVVSSYLQYNKADFQNWHTGVWTQIATLPIFRVRSVASDELGYRQTRVQEIATQKSHCSLSEAGKQSDFRISWSQTRFLSNPPDNLVCETLPQAGRPSCQDVLEHLKFMIARIDNVAIDEMPEFLRDVQACYNYLQTNVEGTKALPDIRGIRIWFNLDTTQLDNVVKDQLAPSLTSASLLCLNSPGKPARIRT